MQLAKGFAEIGGLLMFILGVLLAVSRIEPGLGWLLLLAGAAAMGWGLYNRRRRKAAPAPAPSRVFGDAHFCEAKEIKALGLIRDDGIPLGYCTDDADEPKDAMPSRMGYSGDRHLLTIAPSRTGKGTTAIIPALIEYTGSVLVIDPKGQNAAVTARRRREMGQEVVLLNPFKMHAAHFEAVGIAPSKAVNPLATLDADAPGFVADVASLAEAMIVTNDRDPHWGDSARDLVSAIIMDLVANEKENATLGEVRRRLTLPLGRPGDDGKYPPGSLLHLLREIAFGEFMPAAQRAARFASVDPGSREFASILSTALTQTSFLDDPAIADSFSGDDFRFADLKTRPVSVFLILPSRYIVAYSKFLRLLTVGAIDALTSSPGQPEKPVLLLLDEFAQLGRLSSIENAMALAAGYGVQIWPIVQDINQLKQLYHDRWETFVANTGIIQVFRPNDLTTAEYFSRRTGTRTIEVESRSEQEISVEKARQGFSGVSRSYSKQSVPLMRPLEFFGLRGVEQIVFCAGSEFPIRAGRLAYYYVEDYRGRYDADPYHLPPAPAPAPAAAVQAAPARPAATPVAEPVAAPAAATAPAPVVEPAPVVVAAAPPPAPKAATAPAFRSGGGFSIGMGFMTDGLKDVLGGGEKPPASKTDAAREG